MLPLTLKYVSFSLNTSYLKQLLRLGFPFIFSTIAVWSLTMSDRLILNYFRGAAAVGIYALAYNFANLFNVFLFNPMTLFWAPFFFSYADERSTETTKKLLNRSLVYFFLAGCILYLGITLGSGDVLRIFTSLFAAKEGYWQAATLVPLLTLAPFLYLLNYPAGSALLMAKKPEFIAKAAVIAAAVNVGLNFVFIPRLGAFGAAVATVIAYALFDGLVYRWAQRIWPVHHDWKGLAKGFLFLAIAFIIGWQITITQPWASLFTRVIAGVAVFALLTWFISNILTKAERYKLLAYLMDGRRRLAQGLLRRS
jgi:O-antigen/teichoic acid export membrane protein